MTAELPKTVIASTQIPLCGSMSYTDLYVIYYWRIKEKDKPSIIARFCKTQK